MISLVIGIYRLRRLMRQMRQHGLRSAWKRKFVHTTDSKHALPISRNVLDRESNPTRPNLAWVADITYIQTRSGWLYLAVLLDLFARKVVGWAMASDIQVTLVCHALQLACLTDKTRRVLFVAMNTVTGVVERAMGLSGGLTNTVFAGGIQGAFGLTFVIVQTIADRYRREICRVLVGGADAGLAQIWAGMA